MPHQRPRFLLPRTIKLAKLWPVVGVVGARQVGKSTLLRDQLGIAHHITMDDDDVRADAEASAKAFLAKQPRPILIDEVQKVPPLFDAIKSEVDKKRIPGRFYLTGSTQFSSRLGIQESLTGRLGLLQLFPLTMAEASSLPPLLEKYEYGPLMPSRKLPFDIVATAQHMTRGGMPVPMFFRDPSMVQEYWRGWLETTLYRDMRRLFKKSYDPEFAFRILKKMGSVLAEGELPSVKHLEGSFQKLRSYLEALVQIFVLRRIPIHEAGIGLDAYLFFDAGLAAYMMGKNVGAGTSVTLARHLVWQETGAYLMCAGKHDDRVYYKSARGSPVDMIWDNVAIKIVADSRRTGWDERALGGAMKALKLKKALLVAPTDQIDIPKSSGVGVVPWSYWS